ncbi:COX15/CtaA family protein [Nitrososphaera sp.]|uniref:COX15/CtaA family protein n=1 Tax=Nitrososphaera sp. TaxID=1971748 RepID=UPI00307F1852
MENAFLPATVASPSSSSPHERAAEQGIKKPVVALAFASIGLVYMVMMVGVYLSNGPINDAGIACPEWPLCPNGLSGAPEDRYLIEYVHRVLAVIAAGAVYATAAAVMASSKGAGRGARIASLVAAGIVTVQIVLGYLTVVSSLNPVVVATHLSTGITLFAFGLLTFWWARVWKKQWWS